MINHMVEQLFTFVMLKLENKRFNSFTNIGMPPLKEAPPLERQRHTVVLHRILCVHACSAVPNSSWSHGLQPTRFLCPWNFQGKNSRVGCISYPRGSSQPRNQTLFSCVSCIGRQILYHWAKGKPMYNNGLWFCH